MTGLPKLKIHKPFGYPLEETVDFDKAQYFLFNYGSSVIVAVEGEIMNSYDELLEFAKREHNVGKELLEVWVFPEVDGG